MEYYLPLVSRPRRIFGNSNGILLCVELIVPNGHAIVRQDPHGHLAQIHPCLGVAFGIYGGRQ